MPRNRYDEGVEVLKGMMEGFPVGDPWTPGNMQGPQISEGQRQKVLGLIRSGIDSGVRLVTGGGITSASAARSAAPSRVGGYRNGDEGYKEYLEAKTIGMPE